MKIEKNFLTVNPYSRPGKKLKGVKGVVVHYVGNPNSSALANRNYFESLKDKKSTYASTQYIVGLKGEIIHMMPENEMAYHVGSKTYKDAAVKKLGNYPNETTIGIECCHTDSKGAMPQVEVDALIELCADLCKRYGLNPLEDLWIHNEITGKHCHAWFVNYPNEWKKFKQKVADKMKPAIEKDKAHEDAVAVLVKKGIIGQPEAWLELEKVHIENVKALIKKMANYLEKEK